MNSFFTSPIFLIACIGMLGIGHFEIASLDKSHDVCLDILAMICHTGPFKNFFAATWHTAEVYYRDYRLIPSL